MNNNRWDNKFKIGDKIKLKSFHNTTKAPEGTVDNENYWKLIGLTGHIVSDDRKTNSFYSEMGEQVLVKFETDISRYNLHSHNEVKNSFWFFISYLKVIIY